MASRPYGETDYRKPAFGELVHGETSYSCSIQLNFTLGYFSLLQYIKVFSNRLVLVCHFFLQVSHSKQAAVFCSHFHSLVSGYTFCPLQFCQQVFSCRFVLEPLFLINKQFIIDSLLDWEGHH